MIRVQRHEERLERIEQDIDELKRLWRAIGSPVSGRPTSVRGEFMELFDTHINAPELKDVAFELKIDYDNLPAETKRGKMRELVKQLMKERREYQLLAWLQKKRPDVLWPPSLDTGPLKRAS